VTQDTTQGTKPRRGLLGAIQSADPNKVVFFLSWCKQCEICVSFCPRDALRMNEQQYPYLAYPERCNLCGICEVMCPDFAITIPARHAVPSPLGAHGASGVEAPSAEN